MRAPIVLVLAFAMLVATARPVWAQAAPQASGFQDGFFVQSADGDHRLTLGMVAHLDGRFSFDDPAPVSNTFSLRRLRPVFVGRVARQFEFRIIPDFGNGTVVIQDAFLDFRVTPGFRVRAGKDKVPIGYEMLILVPRLVLPERSLASALLPNRDVGVQAIADVAGGRVHVAGGIFNGIADSSTSTTDVDTNRSKDFAGRIMVRPFAAAQPQQPARPLSGFSFHFGGSAGSHTGPLPGFRTSVLQTYFTYNTGVIADGTGARLAPAAAYYHKAFGGFAEYMRSTQAMARNGVSTDITNQGWNVTASYLLTGEDATTGILRPRHNFDLDAGHWGAFQIAMRYSELSVDDAAFDAGLAAPTASQRARAAAVATNWFVNPYVKYVAMFERTAFDGGAARPTEYALLIRAQLAF